MVFFYRAPRGTEPYVTLLEHNIYIFAKNELQTTTV